jgi:CHAT domain-containing protein
MASLAKYPVPLGCHATDLRTNLKAPARRLGCATLWCLLVILPALLLPPAAARLNAAAARDIQDAQRQAAELHRNRNYVEALNVRKKIYAWSRQAYGARHVQTAAAAFELGQAHMTLGDFGPVEPLFLEAVSFFRSQGGRSSDNVATVLNSLATYYTRVGQIAEAEQAYGECVQILQSRRDTLRLLSVRFNLATMFRHVGLAQGEYAQRAADAAAREKLVADSRARFVKARDLLLQDLNALKGLKLSPEDTRRHNRESVLGEVHLDLGNFQEADRLFSSAQQFWERTRGKDTHGRDLLNLGLSRLALGQYGEGLDFFRRAEDLARQTLGEDNPTYPTTLALQARALAHLGRFKEAAEIMAKCQRLERKYVLRVFPALSQTEQLSYLFRPGYQEGLNLDLALAIGVAGSQNEAIAEGSAEWLLNAKAMVHELLAERTLAARSEPAGLGAEVLKAHSAIAGLITRLNSAAEGSEEFNSARKGLSQWLQREAELTKQMGRTRGGAASPEWIRLNEVREAIPSHGILVEFARFQAPIFGAKGAEAIGGQPRYAAWIIPAAGQGKVRVFDLGDAAPIETSIRQLRDRMDYDVQKLRQEIYAKAEAEIAAYAQNNNLKKTDPAYQKRLNEIAAKAQKDVAEALRDKAPDLLAAYRRNASDCARRILHPLAEELKAAKHIILSPDAHLWLPPWAALPLARDGRLLLESAPVTFVVSGRDLLAARAKGVAASAPVVLGDVNYDRGVSTRADQVEHPAARLYWSPVEVKGIRPHLESYAKMAPVILSGDDASEEKLKSARNPKVLFLSTHGVFGAVDENTFRPGQRGLLMENPFLRCQLSLAGSNRRPAGGIRGEDGRLYGIEVGALDLRATDLVVLSACQTALGDVNAGQGAAGLRQAFQLAGAKSVVATLWSVDDAATTHLTIAFFKRLAEGVPKAEALRQAQLELFAHKKEMSHPFFWAAFTITENGQIPL